MRRLLVWEGIDGWRAEAARVELTGDGLSASGTQLGADPVPYRLDYVIDARDRFITRLLRVEVTGAGWMRRIELHHDGSGVWTCDSKEDGEAELPSAGGDVDALAGALDCDLGLSPLTNSMPVRRHALHERPGGRELLMAWISVPDLGLRPSRQRYEHVRRDSRGSVVRYLDLGAHRGFAADLELDADALVLLYPGLARRVGGRAANPSRP